MNYYLVDLLLGLQKESRNSIIDNLNYSLKERIFESVPKLSDTLGLTLTDDRETRTKKKKEYIDLYKDETHWDYAEFYPLIYKRVSNKRECGVLNDVIVSTNGDMLYLDRENKRLFLTVPPEHLSEYYQRVRIRKIKYPLHRIICSTFIPIPERLKGWSISSLQTNHMDLNVVNNKNNNLEWTTNGENVKHSFNKDTPIGKKGRKTGENYYSDKYILMEVIADNRFKGRKYVINGLDQCESAGFKWASLRYVIDGSKASNYGHKASYITAEEASLYHQGMPEDIKELLHTNLNYFSTDVRPVIGTALSGPFAGVEFSFFGVKEINLHFSQPNVMKVLSGERKQHGNCSWRYGTIEEAIPLHNKLPVETLSSINK